MFPPFASVFLFEARARLATMHSGARPQGTCPWDVGWSCLVLRHCSATVPSLPGCFPGCCLPDGFSSEIHCSKQNGSDICSFSLPPFPTPLLALLCFQRWGRLPLISRWIRERNLIISDLGIHMCLSTTCHASCLLVTTSQEEFKVLIYLLLEMSLGMKGDMWRRGRGREEHGRQHRTAAPQGKTLALSYFACLFAAVLLAGQAKWSMGCEITKDVMGRKLLYL